MTVTPEMLHKCAEALGLKPEIQDKYVSISETGEEWNPINNAEQDRMLRDWLLAKGWRWAVLEPDCCELWNVKLPRTFSRELNCPPNEFLVQVVAEVSK